MTELEVWDAADQDEFAGSIAGDIGFIIDSALDARRDAVIALPWDDFLVPAYEKLAAQKRDWRHVTIVPTHDAIVAVDDDRSGVAKLARLFMPKGARVMPLTGENPDYKLAGNAANARLEDLSWPLDLVLLTLTEEGDMAGIVRGPDRDEGVESPEDIRALGVQAENGDEMVSISGHTIRSARTVLLALDDGTKQIDAEQAAEGHGEGSAAAILPAVTVPVDAHVLTG
ncbi:MAG: 6-phosphogluconolactonase [Pacificimonas sp.]|jgi:6-phosphogluconolactonase|nr:6-phosphogluconolactonase [Pacificimonas sp.]